MSGTTALEEPKIRWDVYFDALFIASSFFAGERREEDLKKKKKQTGLPCPKNLQRLNLAIISFKQGQIREKEKKAKWPNYNISGK